MKALRVKHQNQCAEGLKNLTETLRPPSPSPSHCHSLNLKCVEMGRFKN